MCKFLVYDIKDMVIFENFQYFEKKKWILP